jgi:hypothetical protein
MGQAKNRKKNGTGEQTAQTEEKRIQKTTEPDIRPVITTQNGTIIVTLANVNSGPSDTYRYSTITGKLEKNDEVFPVEWIGSLNISPNMMHRAWIPMKNIFQGWNIPTEPKELKRFIRKRGEEKAVYRVKFGSTGKVGSIYLPNDFDTLIWPHSIL